MGLRTRLLLSYLVVILVTLTVITGTLLLFLNARPAPPQQTYRDLVTFAQANLRSLADTLRPRLLAGQRSELFVRGAAALVADQDIRALVLDTNTQQIVYDSAGVFQEGMTLRWQTAPENDLPQLPRFAESFMRNRLAIFLGGFNDPDTTRWVFVGMQFMRQPGDSTLSLLLAEPLPAQTLRAALGQFDAALVRPVLQAAVIGLLVALVMAAVISQTISRPLQRIAEATRSLGKSPDARAVPVVGPPEVRAVAESINQMSTEVHSTQQAQQDFLVNVSHDLKTPLTSIQGYSQAIMEGATADPVQAATVIYEEAARLNRMVIELTDLARLHNVQLSMQRTPLDLSQIVSAVSQRLSLMAQKKEIILEVDAPPVPEILGDGDRLAQVLTNLISNALKYTPANGTVGVRTQVNHGGVEIIVRDNGIGILAEDLPRVFERFYQVDKARGPRRGTGLGLAITREIVQAHGGTISVTSAGANQGTTFTVWLPAPVLKTASSAKR